jgi:hypothetical protein
VERANRWAAALGHSHHVAYLAQDARTTLTSLLAMYPGAVAVVSVQVGNAWVGVLLDSCGAAALQFLLNMQQKLCGCGCCTCIFHPCSHSV